MDKILHALALRCRQMVDVINTPGAHWDEEDIMDFLTRIARNLDEIANDLTKEADNE